MTMQNATTSNGKRGNHSWYRPGKGKIHARRHLTHYVGESKLAIDQADYQAARAASLDGMFRCRRRRGNRSRSHRS